MEVTLQVRQRGTLILPADLRAKYDIREGDTFRLVDLDGIFVLAPMVPPVPDLARDIEQARRKAGPSMDEMFKGLRKQRKRYYREKYKRTSALKT